MTKRELIEALQKQDKFPDDSPIVLSVEGNPGYLTHLTTEDDEILLTDGN